MISKEKALYDFLSHGVHAGVATEIKRKNFSAKELFNVDIPEPEWLVDGFLPKGLAVLAGKPKTGKSFFCIKPCIIDCSGEIIPWQFNEENRSHCFCSGRLAF